MKKNKTDSLLKNICCSWYVGNLDGQLIFAILDLEIYCSPLVNIRIIMLLSLHIHGSDINMSLINKVFGLEQKFREEGDMCWQNRKSLYNAWNK